MPSTVVAPLQHAPGSRALGTLILQKKPKCWDSTSLFKGLMPRQAVTLFGGKGYGILQNPTLHAIAVRRNWIIKRQRTWVRASESSVNHRCWAMKLIVCDGLQFPKAKSGMERIIMDGEDKETQSMMSPMMKFSSPLWKSIWPQPSAKSGPQVSVSGRRESKFVKSLPSSTQIVRKDLK